MLLMLLGFNLNLGECFKPSHGYVEVHFIINTPKDTIKQVLIKDRGDVYLFEIRPGRMVKENTTRYDTVPLFVYTRNLKSDREPYLSGYVFFGRRWGVLSTFRKKKEGFYTGLHGRFKAWTDGYERPERIKFWGVEAKIDGYRYIDGVGYLPEKLTVYDGGKFTYTRAIEAVVKNKTFNTIEMKGIDKKVLIEEE